MQVYKTFFKVMRKYKLSILMYTGIIIFMLAVLTGTGASGDTAVVQQKYTLLIIDEDQSDMSKELIKYVGSKHNLKKGDYSDDQIKDMLYYESISEYMVIPKGFGEDFAKLAKGEISTDDIVGTLLQATYDEALPRGIFINMQINQYLNAVKDYIADGVSPAEATAKVSEVLDASKYVKMQNKESNSMERAYAAFQFLPFGILTIIFSGTLPIILSFNETERKNRTSISSYRMTSRNMAIALGTATVAVFVTAILVGFASVTNSKEFLFTESWWLSVLNTFIYTFAITMLLSMITSLPLGIANKGTANTTSFVTVIIGLAFAFLGGTFVDLTILGDNVATIGRFTPNYWYSIGLRKIWYDGASFGDLFSSFGLQLLFGITCLSIGLGFTKFFGNKRS